MSINRTTVTKTVHLSKAFEAEARTAVLEEGWGVFRSESGLDCLPSKTLVKVIAEEADAHTEVERLNETEGETVYEVEGDPETSIYHSTSFSAQQVALDGLAVQVQATYSVVAEEA